MKQKQNKILVAEAEESKEPQQVEFGACALCQNNLDKGNFDQRPFVQLGNVTTSRLLHHTTGLGGLGIHLTRCCHFFHYDCLTSY